MVGLCFLCTRSYRLNFIRVFRLSIFSMGLVRVFFFIRSN